MCLYVYMRALPGKAVPEMTYAVSGGTLNPTYSLTYAGFLIFKDITILCHYAQALKCC